MKQEHIPVWPAESLHGYRQQWDGGIQPMTAVEIQRLAEELGAHAYTRPAESRAMNTNMHYPTSQAPWKRRNR